MNNIETAEQLAEIIETTGFAQRYSTMSDVCDAVSDALGAFTPAVRDWFESAFAGPTPVQVEAWAAIDSGDNALVIAPTGSGKTLAAFMHAIDGLYRERDAAQAGGAGRAPDGDDGRARGKRAGKALSAAGPDAAGARLRDASAPPTRVLYVSPLKALGADVQRNLRAPLQGIAARRSRRGDPEARIDVGMRTGDTPGGERARLLRRPPQILITTPESLFLMLTSRARETLQGVRTVIVDEVHAVAGTKRGAHLAVSLERLDALLPRPAQRVGLSATVRPVDEVAAFLGGASPVTVVNPPARLASRGPGRGHDAHPRPPGRGGGRTGRGSAVGGEAAAGRPRVGRRPGRARRPRPEPGRGPDHGRGLDLAACRGEHPRPDPRPPFHDRVRQFPRTGGEADRPSQRPVLRALRRPG